MTQPINIAVVSGTRADYGLLKPILDEIEKSPLITYSLVVSGSHLQAEQGQTETEILNDGKPISARVPLPLNDDSELGISRAVGEAVIGFSNELSRLAPNAVLVLGDRYEIFAAAQTSVLLNIPLIHIHGGETTEGAVDEYLRHAISKLANVHFTSTEEYRQRLLQMGEADHRVFCSGAPGLDNIQNNTLMTKAELAENLQFDLGEQLFVVTYHPVTRAENSSDSDVSEMLNAMLSFPQAKIILTHANSDVAGQRVNQQLKVFRDEHPERVLLIPSLGYKRYLSAAKIADVVIGNSSSGIIEVPSLQTPTVDIGDRQKGRVRSSTVLHCELEQSQIEQAITQALSPEHQVLCQTAKNPYGEGRASEYIVKTISQLDFNSMTQKHFVDREFS